MIYHTSSNDSGLKPGTINKMGIAGDCLFFSHDIYVMSAGSVRIYTLNEEDLEFIEACKLYDDDIIDEIARVYDCCKETAEELLDGSFRAFEYFERLHGDFDCEDPYHHILLKEIEDSFCFDAENVCWLQGKRGECAKKMGYDGCEDEDEQGTVYIIPMLGRESELVEVEEVHDEYGNLVVIEVA